MRVLFSDGLHINNKNFASLMNYLNQVGAVITRPSFSNDSICRFGNYSQWPGIVALGEEMSALSADELFKIKFKGINLFNISCPELMSKCSTKEHWLTADSYGKSPRELFDTLFINDKEDLLLNMASAKYWIDHWFKILASKTFDFIFVFSGSLTYSASLIEVMKGFQGRVFVFESFFTGRHYYCEEKYSHLPNNSDAKFRSQLVSRTAPGAVINEARLERGIKEALNIKNKNVTQPLPLRKNLFNNGKKSILIGGQVLNDFSLLKTNCTGIHSLSIYKSIIERLLSETDLNIIFKAHPWENKKNNLLQPKTKEHIYNHFSDSSRVAIIEDYAISDLFSEIDYVLVINSQLGIEAALQGFKPLQVGNAFYGKHGFTYDIENLDSALDIIKSESSGRLSVQEYIYFREYMMHMLVDYLVPEDVSTGMFKLKQIFNISPVKKPSAPAKEPIIVPTVENKSLPNTINNANNASSGSKKLKKFKNNPKRFFSDSKFVVLRTFGKLL